MSVLQFHFLDSPSWYSTCCSNSSHTLALGHIDCHGKAWRNTLHFLSIVWRLLHCL